MIRSPEAPMASMPRTCHRPVGLSTACLLDSLDHGGLAGDCDLHTAESLETLHPIHGLRGVARRPPPVSVLAEHQTEVAPDRVEGVLLLGGEGARHHMSFRLR